MKSLKDFENMNGQGNVEVVDIAKQTTTHTIRLIKSISFYGLTFYYDKENDKVGFPKWYDESNDLLDYRVGHQFWVNKEQAKAMVLRILELNEGTER